MAEVAEPGNKILEWRPTTRQAQVLSIPDTVFEVLYGGAAGGGKTDLLLNLPIARQFYTHPRFKGIIFRRTYPELEAEVIQRSAAQGLYKAAGGKYNEAKKRWTFPSGASIKFSHLEYDSDVRSHDTAEYNYIGWDELTSFTEYMYLYMFSRCRSSSSNLPSIVRSGTNPGNIGHAWVRGRFVEVAPFGTIVRDKNTGLRRMFVQSFAKDNPHLMENDPEYLSRLSGMAEKDRRAKLDGDWYTFGGQVFNDYRETPYEGEPENAMHLCEPFEIPDWWPKLLAIDWGYQALTYALWGAISPNGRLYLYREYGIKGAKISDWATHIGDLSSSEKFHDIVICQSAGQHRGEDSTIAEKFHQYSKLRARLSINEHGSRVATKLILQELFRWRTTERVNRSKAPFNEKIANQVLRISGLDAYKNYLKQYESIEVENNIPRIQIFNELSLLRKTIPLCVYSDQHPEDVADFVGDDPYDTLRYLGRSFDSYAKIARLQSKQGELATVGEVCEKLKKDQDWTSFYRKMERIEQGKKPMMTRSRGRMYRH